MARKKKKKKTFQLTRDQALGAKPIATKIIDREPMENGGERVTIPLRPTTMQRWLLRLPADTTKKFELDSVGIEVLNLCDGNKTVRYIIKRFSKSHGINIAEAEAAVVAFLRTMVRRGLVFMVVAKQ